MLNYQFVGDGFAREYTYTHRDSRPFRAMADTARFIRHPLRSVLMIPLMLASGEFDTCYQMRRVG